MWYEPIEIVAQDDDEFDSFIEVRQNPPRRMRRTIPLLEFKGLRIKLAVIRDPDFDPAEAVLISSPAAFFDFFGEVAAREVVECMWVVPVTARHRVIGVYEVARGQVSEVMVTPADVLRAVLAVGAPAFFLVHNHPSGDAELSQDDRTLTKRIATAAAVLGVQMLDHIAIGARGRFTAASSEPILLEPASNISNADLGRRR
jgi:hypothetical protein